MKNFGKTYDIAEKSAREVKYADRVRLEDEIIRRHSVCVEMPEEAYAEDEEYTASTGLLHTQVKESDTPVRTKTPVRTE